MGRERLSEVSFAIRGPIEGSDLPELCRRVRMLLWVSGADVAVCDVREMECDAVTVDALARLQLAARRSGRRVHLRGACPELLRLVEFMGLRDVFPSDDSSWSRTAPTESA